jgi:hypothetical protein
MALGETWGDAMSGETLPASATTCTTLHPHDRFSFAFWPRHAPSPRRIDPWPACVDPYEHLARAVPPPVSSLPDTARRQDPIAAGETGVSARRDLRRHVGLILIVRASVRTELSFLYVHSHSHLRSPPTDRCVLLSLVGWPNHSTSIGTYGVVHWRNKFVTGSLKLGASLTR